MIAERLPTVWVLGDQLSRDIGALRGKAPNSCRVLFVESRAMLQRRRWHRQRAHVVLSAMRHFAAELSEGEVCLKPCRPIRDLFDLERIGTDRLPGGQPDRAA